MVIRHAEAFGFFPFGLLSGLAGLLFLAGLVLLIVWLARALVGPNSARHVFSAPPVAAPESPLDILRRRFAAGEMSAEEFQKARDLLSEGPKQ